MVIQTLDLGLVEQRLPFDNVFPSQDLVARGQQNEKGSFLTNTGIGKSGALASNSLDSPTCMQAYPSSKVCMGKSPCDVEMFKQIMDIKRDTLDKNAPHSKEISYSANFGSSLSKLNLSEQPLLCCTDITCPMLDSGFSTQNLYEEHAIVEKARDGMEEASNNVKKLKESITYPNAWKEYDYEFQKLQSKLETERKKLDEVVKKNRRKLWKIVYELETTKKELQGKKVELAKKTAEVEMAKELALKKNEAVALDKKEAYDLWLAGYSSAQSVIHRLHPELNWDGIEAVGNLMFLHYR
ncbi:Endonuclease MutS2 [Bienertia sinuspersici]